MSAYRCPHCDAAINAEDMNVGEGVALCPGCGELSRLHSLVESSTEPLPHDLEHLPDGCDVSRVGDAIRLRASMRSIGPSLPLFGATCFWNGMLTILVLAFGSAIYVQFVGPLPEFFPVPEWDDSQPIKPGEALFLCIFFVPFIIIGVFLMIVSAMYLFGSIDVTLTERRGAVASGIGWLRWIRRFDATQVNRVEIVDAAWHRGGKHGRTIHVEANRSINCGGGLTPVRRKWLCAAMWVLLISRDNAQADKILHRVPPHN